MANVFVSRIVIVMARGPCGKLGAGSATEAIPRMGVREMASLRSP